MKVKLVKDVFGCGTLVGETGTVISHWMGEYKVQFPNTSAPVTVWKDSLEVPISTECWKWTKLGFGRLIDFFWVCVGLLLFFTYGVIFSQIMVYFGLFG